MASVNEGGFLVRKAKGINTIVNKASEGNLSINQKFRGYVSSGNSYCCLFLTGHSLDTIYPFLLEILNKGIRLVNVSLFQMSFLTQMSISLVKVLIYSFDFDLVQSFSIRSLVLGKIFQVAVILLNVFDLSVQVQETVRAAVPTIFADEVYFGFLVAD